MSLGRPLGGNDLCEECAIETEKADIEIQEWITTCYNLIDLVHIGLLCVVASLL